MRFKNKAIFLCLITLLGLCGKCFGIEFFVVSGGSAVSDATVTLADLAKVPDHYERSTPAWAIKGKAIATDRQTLVSPSRVSVNINNDGYVLVSPMEYDLSVLGNWDTGTPTNYTVAANRAGKDFYFYACVQGGTTTPVFVLSANSTVPTGYGTDTSRKVGGFHCLCVNVGTITGHSLTGFLAGDLLPNSIWDLNHRPHSSPEGMVYSENLDIWVDIYLASGTGTQTASVYNATISDTRSWLDLVDDGSAVKKRLLTDVEFQVVATGSNEETNIAGSADPVTTGGHNDTAGRRMISNIGCEDCCGAMYQWLQTSSTRLDDSTTAGWYVLPGSKGGFYTYGTNKYGNTQLQAGAAWNGSTFSGSRSRNSNSYRWITNSNLGCRFASEPAR